MDLHVTHLTLKPEITQGSSRIPRLGDRFRLRELRFAPICQGNHARNAPCRANRSPAEFGIRAPAFMLREPALQLNLTTRVIVRSDLFSSVDVHV